MTVVARAWLLCSYSPTVCIDFMAKKWGDGRVPVLFFLFGKHPRTTDATLLPLLKNGPLVDNMDPTAPEFHHLPSS